MKKLIFALVAFDIIISQSIAYMYALGTFFEEVGENA